MQLNSVCVSRYICIHAQLSGPSDNGMDSDVVKRINEIVSHHYLASALRRYLFLCVGIMMESGEVTGTPLVFWCSGIMLRDSLLTNNLHSGAGYTRPGQI